MSEKPNQSTEIFCWYFCWLVLLLRQPQLSGNKARFPSLRFRLWAPSPFSLYPSAEASTLLVLQTDEIVEFFGAYGALKRVSRIFGVFGPTTRRVGTVFRYAIDGLCKRQKVETVRFKDFKVSRMLRPDILGFGF
ncbi:MAG: hypothetical protein EOQ40_23240 [Mesorhizobium sp.]|uniref:hypothetical protein n=1 Tax=Mesorhizobium sp. TaxID=1871066 RepID=UPI000FE79B59|nr:hypothetical protein [Mesorhizobium sp.]RWB18737.1 MAG: hypothetical protein EOQ40_23240 [Mesorhizobium sp.]